MRFLPAISLLVLFACAWSLAAAEKSKASGSKTAPASGKGKSSGEKALKPDPAAPKVEWKPIYHNRQAYVPLEQVASYYDMPIPKSAGREITLANKYFRIELTRGERRMKLNGWTFYFSYTVSERSGKTLVSVFDVRNVLDPIMRPNDRRDPAVLQTVVIDPAGGGKESGIVSPLIAEKDLTLDVAKKLADRLKAAGLKVILTRDSDTLVTAGQRRKIADAVTEEAIFISLKAGSSGSGSTRGFECSTLPPAGTPATDEPESREIDKRLYAGNINDRESLALATVLQNSAVTNLKTVDLGIKRIRFPELRDISLPAVVCRVGCLSNKDESARLAAPEYRDLVAKGLSEGVQRYARFLSDKLDERREEDLRRPLRFGTIKASCTLEGAGITGEQVVLEVPIMASGAVTIDRSRVEVQLYLFETVNDAEIDVTTANAPKIEWLSILPDWKATRTEILQATWLRPPFGAVEIKEFGKRAYHGYVARLIYDGRVMDESSSPQNLNRCLFYFTNVFPRR